MGNPTRMITENADTSFKESPQGAAKDVIGFIMRLVTGNLLNSTDQKDF